MKKILILLVILMSFYALASGVSLTTNKMWDNTNFPLDNLYSPATWKHFFVTSATYNGDLREPGLDGIQGANAKCNRDDYALKIANGNSLSDHTYKAVVYPQLHPNLAGASFSNFYQSGATAYYTTSPEGYLLDHSLAKLTLDGMNSSFSPFVHSTVAFTLTGGPAYNCNNFTTSNAGTVHAANNSSIRRTGEITVINIRSCNSYLSLICVEE